MCKRQKPAVQYKQDSSLETTNRHIPLGDCLVSFPRGESADILGLELRLDDRRLSEKGGVSCTDEIEGALPGIIIGGVPAWGVLAGGIIPTLQSEPRGVLENEFWVLPYDFLTRVR